MDSQSALSGFLDATGTVGYILTIIAIINLIIIVYKLYEYVYASVIPNPYFKGKWKSFFAGAKTKEQIAELGEEYMESLEHGFIIFSLSITIAPLLGLLGTVIGMIDAFQVMASLGDNANVASLAGGIWKALITTAAGLSIAIFVLIFLTLFRMLLAKHINKVNKQLK